MPKNSEKIYTPKIGSMFSEKQESKKSASEPENKSNFFKNRKRKYSGE